MDGTAAFTRDFVTGERRYGTRQDIVDVHLKAGWNDVMLKVVNHEAGWAFCCRFRKPDGTAIEGLKVEAQ